MLTCRTHHRPSQAQERKAKSGQWSQSWNTLHLLPGLLWMPPVINISYLYAKGKSSICILVQECPLMWGAKHKSWNHTMPTPLLTSTLALVKLWNFSKPQFPQQANGRGKINHMDGVWSRRERIYVSSQPSIGHDSKNVAFLPGQQHYTNRDRKQETTFDVFWMLQRGKSCRFPLSWPSISSKEEIGPRANSWAKTVSSVAHFFNQRRSVHQAGDGRLSPLGC